MKLLLTLLLSVASGCSSYVRKTDDIIPHLDHAIHGDKITLKATLTNNTKRSITFVRHPDFSSFRMWATDNQYITDKNLIVISYYPATLYNLETVRPGKSITFEETFAYCKISPNLVMITELPVSDHVNSFTMRSEFAEAEFSYGFYDYNFPILGRFFRQGVVLGDVEVSKIIQIQ